MWIFVGGFLAHLNDKNPAGYYVREATKRSRRSLEDLKSERKICELMKKYQDSNKDGVWLN